MSVLPAWLPLDVASGSTARPVVLRGTVRGHSRGDALTTIVRVAAATAWLGAALWLWRDPAWRPAIILVGAIVGWSLDVVPDFVVALGLPRRVEPHRRRADGAEPVGILVAGLASDDRQPRAGRRADAIRTPRASRTASPAEA